MNTTPPAISGTPQEGRTLTEEPGSWSSQGSVLVTMAWEDCATSAGTGCTPIQGANTTPGSNYTLGPGDVGKYIVVVETASNPSGSSTAQSAPPALVSPAGTTTSVLVLPNHAVSNQAVNLVATVTSSESSASPSGTITFFDAGGPVGGCVNQPVSPTGQSVTVVCQAAFPASLASLTAVFTPGVGSGVGGSSSSPALLSVGRDATTTSLGVPISVLPGAPATATATISPSAAPGPFVPGGTAEFFDNGRPIGRCRAQPVISARATCTLRYRSISRHAITARYQGDGNFTPSSSSRKTVGVVAAGNIAATALWTFFASPTSTRVGVLLVQGAAHTRVLVTCRGRGCPFARRVHTISARRACKRRAHGHCRASKPPAGTYNVASAFGNRHLAVGARIAIAITRPGWIGKYYLFTIRSRQAPRIQVSCLAPGATRPGGRC